MNKIRRPVVIAGMALAAGIVIQDWLQKSLLTWMGAAAICIAIDCVLQRKKIRFMGMSPTVYKRALALFFVFFFIGTIYFQILSQKQSFFAEMYGETVTVSGYVTEVVVRNDTHFKIKLKDQQARELILVTVIGERIESPFDLIGRKVLVSGIAERPSPARNPGCFDYQQYLKTQKIHTLIKANHCDLKLTAVPQKYWYRLVGYKYQFLKKAQMHMNADAFGVFTGLLFGDKSYLDEAVYETFQKNGTAHILAVSGIHIGIIYSFLERLLRRPKGFAVNIIIMTTLIFYAFISGFSPSVVRAVFMIIVYIISKLLHERYDFLSNTAFTFTVLLLVNPYQLFHVGFQMSFLAVFSLAVILPWANMWVKRKRQWVSLLLPVIVIQLGMLPATAYLFNYVSLSAFVINIPVMFLAGIMIPFGLAALMLSFVHPLLFQIALFAEEILIHFMLWINQLMAVRGIGYFYVASPSISFLCAYYFCLFFFCSERGQSVLKAHRSTGNGKRLAAIGTLILFLSVIGGNWEAQRLPQMVFLDVGQGDAFHIRTPSGKHFLVDGGGIPPFGEDQAVYDVGKKILLPYLLKNGVTVLDGIFVSHMHVDHYQGLASLSNHLQVKQLYLSEGYQVQEEEIAPYFRTKKDDIKYLKAGDRISLDKDIHFEIIYPVEERASLGTDENERSMVMRLHYQDLTVLLTGDIGEKDENSIRKILESNGITMLKPQVIKVPHHGSKYSSSDQFLDFIDAKIAVISVGKNHFGHPNQGIIEKYQRKGIMIFRTDLHGAVCLSKHKTGWYADPMMKRERGKIWLEKYTVLRD